MGLAASQARFFTITSRLSSIELKQQRIAMDKMRLANDQANIASKYTAALNNKTLQFSNGSNGNVALDYSTLVDNGYAIMRLSDGVVAGSDAGANGIATTADEASSRSSSSSSSNYVAPEVLKWVGQPAPTAPEAPNKDAICGQEPTKPTQKLEKPIEYRNYTVPQDLYYQEVNMKITLYKNLDSTVASGGNINHNQPIYINAANDVLTSAGKYIQALKDGGLEDTYNYIHSDFETASSQFASAKNTDNAGQAADQIVSQISTAMSSIQDKAKKEASDKNAIVSSMTQAEYQEKLNAYNQNQADWTSYNTNYAQYKNKYENEYQPKYKQYQKDLKQYKVDYKNWTIAQNINTNGSTTTTGSATGTTTGTTATASSYDLNSSSSQSFANQLRNSQYLVQGLLNNQFVLMKNGQQVSLASETSILEVDDESDDAKAEAEYNSEMRKTNNKEKILDMQSKAVDTEYSALKTEYESVKSLISEHADKDFTMFS